MIAFANELVARGIFVTVTMIFLMVGHIHENIDVAFSRVSLHIKRHDIGILPQLMGMVWECQEEKHMVSFLIQR